MRTPDGRECPYYYADVQRWHTGREECRLLEGQTDAAQWTSDLCATCPVPNIHRANACPNMKLHARTRGRIRGRIWRFWEKPGMVITASCSKSGGPVANPYIGCGQCHEELTFITQK